MTRDELQALLERVASGAERAADVAARLATLPVGRPSEQVGPEGRPFATLDHHRELRQGLPEVVYGEGKSAEQVVAICRRLAEVSGSFLVTRAGEPVRDALAAAFPGAIVNVVGRTVRMPRPRAEPGETPPRRVLLVSAGTSDLPVVEECAETLLALGLAPERIVDVGVAGLHRVLAHAPALAASAVTIVVAGMDGALASVIGGLVRGAVIAVPTSVGYGAGAGGIAPLLTMLNSCAAGVTVVNVDNGFGAAMAAGRILLGARGYPDEDGG